MGMPSIRVFWVAIGVTGLVLLMLNAQKLSLLKPRSSLRNFGRSHASQGVDREILGRIPFYLYPLSDFAEVNAKCDIPVGSTYRFTHRNDTLPVLFYEKLQNHKWRVENPDDAALFVPPINVDMAVGGGCGNVQGYLSAVKTVLEGLKPFKEKKSHLTLMGTAKAIARMRNDRHSYMRFLNKFIIGSSNWKRLDLGKEYCSFKIPFLPDKIPNNALDERDLQKQAAEQYANRESVAAMIARATDIREATADRRFVVEVMSKMKSKSYLYFFGPERPKEQESWFEDFDMPRCDETLSGCSLRLPEHADSDLESTKRWKQLSDSRFNLQFAHDVYGSQKLENAALVGTFNVILDDSALDFVMPFPCLLPWTQMTYYMNKSAFIKNPSALLTEAINGDQANFAGRLRLYQDHIADILWVHPASRVPENALLTAARRCVPEAHLNEQRLTKFDYQCTSSVYSQSG
ncbi:MAG: hypothetical protein KVP17_005102 [Porospora cf. gigantea B]|uniref:uncharacterized protein n=1 Tax=Porospora cf. gigantea B TaxID=2853592 RepID=UPI003571AA55|nr:MAG: hypothetical protein KVP17_005102 [Porospora cf. gigantea B]